MSVVSIINRNFLKTAVSVRCLSWHSNYVQGPGDQTVNRQHICSTKKLPAVTLSNGIQCRFKYNKSQNKKGDDEEDDGSTSTDRDFYDAEITTVRVSSLRMDLIVKSGLGLARNKIESAFYDSKIRVNGNKVAKKSVTLRLQDEVDIIKGLSPLNKEHLIVSRLVIVKAKANEEDISIGLRRYKNLTIENYSGQNAYKQSETAE
ncbi:mitochondrial transcription rescue factor 1 [Bradysia coprophila]|uniref:mitochondrial transcription rescue factor 1 n=1 Tax=Bradysia coprophila TaxID=38358 RepID=UPI00187D8B1E|nr:mitochondrial transcription rescue factor 1 [Bradysia coprophila]